MKGNTILIYIWHCRRHGSLEMREPEMGRRHQIVRCDVRGVVPAALQEVHGLPVADGAHCALLIRLQALPEQPVGLLQVACLSAVSRVTVVQVLLTACHMHGTSQVSLVFHPMMQQQGPERETCTAGMRSPAEGHRRPWPLLEHRCAGTARAGCG